MNDQLKNELGTIFNSQVLLKNYEASIVTSQVETGATESDINSIATGLTTPLPNDYLEFLKFTNGCTIYNYQDLDGFRFFGADELIRQYKAFKELYGEDWNERIIVFCAILGEGNFIAFRILGGNNYEILDCFHEDPPADWKVIETSFDKFLERLISLKGQKYWLS